MITVSDRDGNGGWADRPGTVSSARARMTTAALRAVAQAHRLGLSVRVYGTARTEITGTTAVILAIAHQLPASPAHSRVTRFRVTSTAGKIIDTFDAATAAQWITAQAALATSGTR